MKLIVLVLFLALAAEQTDGTSINRNTSDLMEDLKEFRNTLVEKLDGLPNEFFDLELTINNLEIEENAELAGEVANFRKDLSGISGEMQDDLFDIELAINNILYNKDTDDHSDDDSDDDSDDKLNCSTWYLGMNLNPVDFHIMDYTTGWRSDTSIGTEEEALLKDYKNQTVWEQPANYISIVRHQNGTIDAVKVFEFIDGGLSLFERFDSNNAAYYRSIVTSGGPIQEAIAPGAPYMSDDPMFSVAGDLAFNWGYDNNGIRVALTGSDLPAESVYYNNAYGLGGHFHCNPRTGSKESADYAYRHEIDILCPGSGQCYKVQGLDHGSFRHYNSGPMYGNYAIYVSQDATTFPQPGQQLELEIQQCR